METDPSNTRLKEVIDMFEEHAVKFVFDVIKDVPWSERIIVNDVLILSMIIAMISLLCIIAFTSSRSSKRISKEISTNNGEPSNIRQGSVDVHPLLNDQEVELLNLTIKNAQNRNVIGSRGDVGKNKIYDVPRGAVGEATPL